MQNYRLVRELSSSQAELHLAAHAAVLALMAGLEVAEVPVREGRLVPGQRAPVAARRLRTRLLTIG